MIALLFLVFGLGVDKLDLCVPCSLQLGVQASGLSLGVKDWPFAWRDHSKSLMHTVGLCSCLPPCNWFITYPQHANDSPPEVFPCCSTIRRLWTFNSLTSSWKHYLWCGKACDRVKVSPQISFTNLISMESIMSCKIV